MKRAVWKFNLLFLILVLTFSAFAQDNGPKDELFGKIAKLSQTKKPADQEKAYQLAKEYMAKFGKDSDDHTKKIKDFVDKYKLAAFDKKLNEKMTAEAFVIGKEILAQEPENSYITMNLAYGGYEALLKKKDISFSEESIKFAKQTLSLFEAGKLPKTFEPFKDQTEATALMYYIIGNFLLDSNSKEAAQNFYKTVQYESQFKQNSYPYYGISFFYEKEYQKAATEYQAKYANITREDDGSRAAQAKLEKLLDRMLDAYARAIKMGEVEKNPSVDGWKKRFTDIYKFRFQNDTGISDYLEKTPNTPLADPNTL